MNDGHSDYARKNYENIILLTVEGGVICYLCYF